MDYGLVINRNRKYDLSADIFPVNLDQRRKVVLALYDYLSFLSHTAPFNVPYYFAAQKCRLDLLITCGMASSQIPEMPVLYRHNYLYYTLDDEVLYFILQAVRERMQLKITFKKDRRNYREGDTKYSCRTADVIPVKVRHDASSGRQYLLCVNLSESSERADSIRLDRIMDVKPEAPLPSAKWNQAEQEIEKFSHTWCASAYFDHACTMTFTMHYPAADHYSHMRLNQEKQHGVIADTVQDENGRIIQETMKIDVSDPGEMLPWIRSFGSVMQISGNTETEKKLKEQMVKDWKGALKAYEEDSGF